MGYIENCLPRALAKLGHEVHVVTSQAQVYYNHPFYDSTYGNYLGAPIQPVGTTKVNDVQIHRLPFRTVMGRIVLSKFANTIRQINPDVVHTFDHASIDTFRLCWLKIMGLRFKLFTASHAVLSVFPLAKNWDSSSFFQKMKWNILQRYPGQWISQYIEKCFCVTVDAAIVATGFLGVEPDKIKVTTLGVDTDLFYPVNDAIKRTLKADLGFDPNVPLCIYTGRLTAQKQPILLAQAVKQLQDKHLEINALFIGEGEQSESIAALGFLIFPLQPYNELPRFYNAADIGVWAGEESTSQLDAVGAGLCLVLTDHVKAYDTVESAHATVEKPCIVSRFFERGNAEHLAAQLETLLDNAVRQQLIERGVATIQQQSSWDVIAQARVADYEAAIG